MSLVFAVIGSLCISAATIALGAPVETQIVLLPVHIVWGMLCGVLFG